jgi:hypothetical protein
MSRIKINIIGFGLRWLAHAWHASRWLEKLTKKWFDNYNEKVWDPQCAKFNEEMRKKWDAASD